MKRLNGGCHTLIGCYAEIKKDNLYIIGTFEVNGKIVVKDITGKKDDNIQLGIKNGQSIYNWHRARR